MIEQKITLKKHFKHVWPYILFSFIMLFIMLYDWANTIENDNKAIYIIYLVFGAVSTINIYLHLEYYFINRRAILLYSRENQEIRYKEKQREDIIILPELIKSIEIHQSRFFKKKGGFLTTDNYHFYKFVLQDGKAVVITSLLYPDFEYKLEGITEVKERTVASILIG